MFYKKGITAGLIAAAAAVPAPNSYSYNQQPSVNSAAVSSVTSVAGIPASEIPGATGAVPPIISPEVTGTTSHGPYSGTATTPLELLSTTALASEIPILHHLEKQRQHNVPDGTLHEPQPVPYQPAGGLYQEWIELDLFHDILARFTEEEFTAAGLTASDRFLIEFMADQEAGHATMLSNLLGGPGGATPQCTYNYPYTTVTEAFDFAQKLTRYGESGVWGFQAHLDSREVAQLLDQSIATEAPSSLAKLPTTYCSLNQPNVARRNATQTGFNETVGFGPAAPSNSSLPPNESCVGNKRWHPQMGYVGSQLNVTYSPLTNVSSANGVNYGMTIQPDVSTYEGDPAINGTMFLALTDTDITYTAFNLSNVNPHVVALAMYQAG
ncbi:hypothetical protein EYC84_000661 [Monilinia fructicola]|uniref:Protein rds1 n=1 Tax=Monilinia fructicola TaxID=38448 RepID=A0A5M9JQ19_MONFR|nr:hypothetical protein EYC84_000661 [Monilinia fructicola]